MRNQKNSKKNDKDFVSLYIKLFLEFKASLSSILNTYQQETYLTKRQAASRLQISLLTLNSLISDGKILAYRTLDSNRICIKESDVRNFIQAKKSGGGYV